MERTDDNAPSEKKKEKKKAKSTPSNRVVWLFSAHDAIPEREMLRLLTQRQLDNRLKSFLGFAPNTLILPIFGEIEDRFKAIEVLENREMPVPTLILVAGNVDDLSSKEMTAASSDHAVIIEASELQFYNDTKVVSPGSYRAYHEDLKALKETVDDVFESVDILK